MAEIVSNNDDEDKERMPIIDLFDKYCVELDAFEDLWQKVLQKSREITQESKKIIFLLHRIEKKNTEAEKILQQAKDRLKKVFLKLTNEVGAIFPIKDKSCYIWAFSYGMQEFIESIALFYYFKFGKLVSVESIYEAPFLFEEGELKDSITGMPMCHLLTLYHYILGILDFTGEIMRRCIETDSNEEAFLIRSILWDVYQSVKTVNAIMKVPDLPAKWTTLDASLHKVEATCYSISLRNAESVQQR